MNTLLCKIDSPQHISLSKEQMIKELKTEQEHSETGPLIEGHELAQKMREKYAI